MHRCLRVAELLNYICSFADEATLHSLALTCRSFHDAAIEYLWVSLPSILPLLKCFPSDVVKGDFPGDLVGPTCSDLQQFTQLIVCSSDLQEIAEAERLGSL